METRNYVLTVVGLLVVLALLGWVLFSDTEGAKEPRPSDDPSVSQSS